METSEVLAALKKTRLFRRLDDSDLRELAEQMEERTFAAGDVLGEEGDEITEWSLIIEGEVRVSARQASIGFETTLAALGPGDYFGEWGLLLQSRRAASLHALIDGRLLVLPRDAFLEKVTASPQLCLAACRGIVRQAVDLLTRAYAEVPLVNLSDYTFADEVRALIPPRTSLLCRAVAVDRSGDTLTVAMVDPYQAIARNMLQETLAKYRLEFVGIRADDFAAYEEQHLSEVSWSGRAADEAESLVFVNADGEDEAEGTTQGAQLVSGSLRQALHFGASDVHIETAGRAGRVRMRIDGNMTTLNEGVGIEAQRQAVSRLKVLAELDINERRLPQDGSFRLRSGSAHIDVRLSTTPCMGGEKAVMRILDPRQQSHGLASLILCEPVARQVENLFLQPSGLVLVTGPAGAGKTTTLYAGLNRIWKRSTMLNLITIEDPVEYQLPFATQIQVDRPAGLDFARILRATLRQDPNVLLVGEIRDRESALIALEAAGSGHLVLSSLHTHFALDAIARLRNLDVPSYLIASAVRAVISQRLLPRNCPSCLKTLPASSPAEQRLQQLGILPDGWSGELGVSEGCAKCGNTGQQGRMAMYEVLVADQNLCDLIERDAPTAKLREALEGTPFVSMAAYARYLLEEKLASPESVARAFPSQSSAEEA